MERKITAGFYLTVCSTILSVMALVSYFVNVNTNYFKNLGIVPLVVAALIFACVINIIYIVSGMKKNALWSDIIPVLSSLSILISFLSFASSRVNGFAAIITFENNASNMADLKSAVAGIVFCFIALVINVVSSFFDVTRTRR